MQTIKELIEKSNFVRQSGHNRLNTDINSLDCLIAITVALVGQDKQGLEQAITTAKESGLFAEEVSK